MLDYKYSTKLNQAFPVLLVAAIGILYLTDNFIIGKWLGGFWGNYVVRPLLWAMLAVLVIRVFPGVRPAGKLRLRKFLCWMAFLCGALAIIASLATGVLDGFGESPYDLSPRGMLTNLIFLGTFVAGLEFSRAWLITRVFRSNPTWGVAVVSLFFALFWFPASVLTTLTDNLEIAQFLGITLFPAISENLLTSYLALLGGAWPAIVYRGTWLAFEWFFPILPDPGWVTKTLVATFIPLVGLTLVRQYYLDEKKSRKELTREENHQASLITGIAAIIIIWFCAGVFSIFPSVIVSGSMLPVIQIGDVVIVKKIPAEQVQVGDIIQFKTENIRVAHRVIDIREENHQKVLITKGDNNQAVDSDPVLPEQVVGRVVAIIPKIGWPSMIIHSADLSAFKLLAEQINGEL
ncbi:MAG: signal peptidase I [Syntrophomonadaceae bacterium]|nr:signal peptidase I [Syntrophomonadaceae bacterium]